MRTRLVAQSHLARLRDHGHLVARLRGTGGPGPTVFAIGVALQGVLAKADREAQAEIMVDAITGTEATVAVSAAEARHRKVPRYVFAQSDPRRVRSLQHSRASLEESASCFTQVLCLAAQDVMN